MQLGHVAEAEAAFKKALSLDDPSNPGIHAMRVLAQMKQGLGDHWAAIRVLSKAIDLDNNPERIQCLFLRGDHQPLACTSLHACMARAAAFGTNLADVYLGIHVRAMLDLLCLVMQSVCSLYARLLAAHVPVRPAAPVLHAVHVCAWQHAKLTAASLAHLDMCSSNIRFCVTARHEPRHTLVLLCACAHYFSEKRHRAI